MISCLPCSIRFEHVDFTLYIPAWAVSEIAMPAGKLSAVEAHLVTRISSEGLPACSEKGCLAVFSIMYDYADDESEASAFLAPLLNHIPESQGRVVRHTSSQEQRIFCFFRDLITARCQSLLTLLCLLIIRMSNLPSEFTAARQFLIRDGADHSSMVWSNPLGRYIVPVTATLNETKTASFCLQPSSLTRASIF